MEGEVAENIGGGGGRALATHRAQSLDVNHLIADAVQDTVPLQDVTFDSSRCFALQGG